MSSSPVSVRLSGGLGNQMFQYAFGRALAEARQAPLLLARHGFNYRAKGETPRSYALDAFVLNPSVTVSDAPYSFLLNRIARKVPALQGLLGVHHERNTSYDASAMTDAGAHAFDGYWQSYRYFEGLAPALRAEFSIRGPLSASFLQHEADMADTAAGPSVMLHVRRGDYVSLAAASAHHGALGLAYYQAAVAKVLAQMPDARFFVFSDDIDWCRQALDFLPAGTRFVAPDRDRTDAQEMILMSRCQHHIIANSSFSWWAAWLANPRADGSGRLTFAPAAWFASQAVDPSSRFPSHWTVL